MVAETQSNRAGWGIWIYKWNNFEPNIQTETTILAAKCRISVDGLWCLVLVVSLVSKGMPKGSTMQAQYVNIISREPHHQPSAVECCLERYIICWWYRLMEKNPQLEVGLVRGNVTKASLWGAPHLDPCCISFFRLLSEKKLSSATTVHSCHSDVLPKQKGLRNYEWTLCMNSSTSVLPSCCRVSGGGTVASTESKEKTRWWTVRAGGAISPMAHVGHLD